MSAGGSSLDAVTRTLAMASWVAAQPGGVLKDELCERFGLTPGQLERDLQTLHMTGVYPHTDYELVSLSDDGETISIRYDGLDRPMPLTAPQALALIAAGESLTDLPDTDPNGPLARGLAKLAEAMGVIPGETLDVEFAGANSEALPVVFAATKLGTQVWIRYEGLDSGEESERVIEPWVVGVDKAAWSVTAWCHRANDRRWFRLDRVLEVRALDTPASMPRTATTAAWEPPSHLPRATLVLDGDVAWAAERWNCDQREVLDDGRVRVVVPVGGSGWFERMLMQLGPRVTVERIVAEGQDLGQPDRAAVARRILKRYGE